jgi:hypothetical protein
MNHYINNLLPRIKRFSKNLNNIELFVDKSWILYGDDTYNKIEYTFCRDNTLVKSVNGYAHQGTWRLLPTGKLIIKVENISIQLEKVFLNEGFFVLNISGEASSGYIFYNEDIINNNLKSYLESLERRVEIAEKEAAEAERIEQENLKNAPTFTLVVVIIIALLISFLSYIATKID